MFMRISISLKKGGFTPNLCLLFLFLIPVTGYAQKKHNFSKDSIPVADGKVIFSIDFQYDLDKKEFMKRAVAYLNGRMEPYSGVFLVSNKDSTVCRITDYLEVDANVAQLFAVYVTYNLRLYYEQGKCKLTLSDFIYMDKIYFEKQEESERKLDMPEYSGEEVMVKKSYARLLTKDPSGQVTASTVKRINEIIDYLELSFARK